MSDDLFLDIDRLRGMAAAREDRRALLRGIAWGSVLTVLLWTLVLLWPLAIKGGIWLLS